MLGFFSQCLDTMISFFKKMFTYFIVRMRGKYKHIRTQDKRKREFVRRCRSSIDSATWMLGALVLEPSSTAFPGTLARCSIRSTVAEAEISTAIWMYITGDLKCYTAVPTSTMLSCRWVLGQQIESSI